MIGAVLSIPKFGISLQVVGIIGEYGAIVQFWRILGRSQKRCSIKYWNCSCF